MVFQAQPLYTLLNSCWTTYLVIWTHAFSSFTDFKLYALFYTEVALLLYMLPISSDIVL